MLWENKCKKVNLSSDRWFSLWWRANNCIFNTGHRISKTSLQQCVQFLSESSLHFAWVVDDAKCIVVTRDCVCVSLCLSAACPRYCLDPDVNWGSGMGCPLVVHYWADLQSMHVLRCYGNIRRTRNVSKYMLVLALCLVMLLLIYTDYLFRFFIVVSLFKYLSCLGQL